MILGSATKLFAEMSPQNSLTHNHTQKKHGNLPLLDRLLAANNLHYIDHAIAKKFSQGYDETVACLICHLSMASRQGHLCVRITQDTITPSVADVWDSEETEQITAEDLQQLSSMILAGAAALKPPLINVRTGSDMPSNAVIQRNGDCYYFQKFWQLETEFISHLLPFLAAREPQLKADMAMVSETVSKFLEQKKLLQEQADAVLQGCQGTLTLITGGPGTGKTYTAGMLLRILWHSLDASQRQQCRIVLAAPTGKAAANLEGSIQRALNAVDAFPAPATQTLHQLLGINTYSKPSSNSVIPADIIIVDECSMIDINLMGQLLSAIRPGARLIMLGDNFQLPSIEAGSLFSDMTTFISKSEACKHILIALKTCLRTESQDIVTLAADIKSGNIESVSKLWNLPSQSSIRFVTMPKDDKPKELQQQLLNYALPHFSQISYVPENPLEQLHEFSKFRILTPVRQGPLGTEMLNKIISDALSAKASAAPYHTIPIMIVKNDYRLGLFNGEVGLLVKPRDTHSASHYAIFASRQTKNEARKIPALLLPSFEHAYCLSVHKSQGSEFDHVVLLLTDGAELFGRAGIYTGATRAKKQLEIWSRPEIVTEMISHVTTRHSDVVNRLGSVNTDRLTSQSA